MKTVLVLHQLLVIIEREARPIARQFGLTPEDVLILGWLVDHDATRGSLIADRLGRSRQSVQRSLERLERDALVERYGHSIACSPNSNRSG
jgi:DNA-binding MarR family transcriptional regulator